MAQTNASRTYVDPHQYLNATVHVGTIDLEVDNLTAKVGPDEIRLVLLSIDSGGSDQSRRTSA